jgi:hypothetical protein
MEAIFTSNTETIKPLLYKLVYVLKGEDNETVRGDMHFIPIERKLMISFFF